MLSLFDCLAEGIDTLFVFGYVSGHLALVKSSGSRLCGCDYNRREFLVDNAVDIWLWGILSQVNRRTWVPVLWSHHVSLIIRHTPTPLFLPERCSFLSARCMKKPAACTDSDSVSGESCFREAKNATVFCLSGMLPLLGFHQPCFQDTTRTAGEKNSRGRLTIERQYNGMSNSSGSIERGWELQSRPQHCGFSALPNVS